MRTPCVRSCLIPGAPRQSVCPSVSLSKGASEPPHMKRSRLGVGSGGSRSFECRWTEHLLWMLSCAETPFISTQTSSSVRAAAGSSERVSRSTVRRGWCQNRLGSPPPLHPSSRVFFSFGFRCLSGGSLGFSLKLCSLLLPSATCCLWSSVSPSSSLQYGTWVSLYLSSAAIFFFRFDSSFSARSQMDHTSHPKV